MREVSTVVGEGPHKWSPHLVCGVYSVPRSGEGSYGIFRGGGASENLADLITVLRSSLVALNLET